MAYFLFFSNFVILRDFDKINVVILEIFVKNQNEGSGVDGSYSKPFKHIVKALTYAKEKSAPYNKAIINIFLLKGDHVMSRKLK